LGGKGGVQGVGSSDEGRAEGVAYGLEDMAAVGFNGFSEESIVAGNGSVHLLGVLLPAPGAAFYVGE